MKIQHNLQGIFAQTPINHSFELFVKPIRTKKFIWR